MDSQETGSQLVSAIAQTPVQDAGTLAATVQILRGLSSETLLFDAQRLVLRPASASAPDAETAQRLFALAKGAQDAAYAQGFTSLVVGGGSESDETSDVAVWLGGGEFGFGHAAEVLAALGLRGEISRAELSSGSGRAEVELNGMERTHRFVVSIESRVGVMLVGRMGTAHGGGWGGLVGLGVWT